MTNETKFIWHKETNKYIMKGKPISLKIKGQIFISFFQYFNIAIKNNSIFMHRSIENWMQILCLISTVYILKVRQKINILQPIVKWSRCASKSIKMIVCNRVLTSGINVREYILKRNNICFMLRKGCFLVYDLSKVNSIKC